jgi:hypothetical protein
MEIKVIHSQYNDDGIIIGHEEVAVVSTPIDDVEQSLEYAFRWTNNTDGSWSVPMSGFMINGETVLNNDYNARVKYVGERHEHIIPTHLQGYGARSTSVGDLMVVDGEVYEVRPFGFRLIEEAA